MFYPTVSSISNIRKDFIIEENKVILENINSSFLPNSLLLLKGLNGSGKSTLINKKINKLTFLFQTLWNIDYRRFFCFFNSSNLLNLNLINLDSIKGNYLFSALSLGNQNLIIYKLNLYLFSFINYYDEIFNGLDKKNTNLVKTNLLQNKALNFKYLISSHQNIFNFKTVVLFLN